MRSLCKGSPVCVLYALPSAVIMLSVFALGVGVGVGVLDISDDDLSTTRVQYQYCGGHGFTHSLSEEIR